MLDVLVTKGYAALAPKNRESVLHLLRIFGVAEYSVIRYSNRDRLAGQFKAQICTIWGSKCVPSVCVEVKMGRDTLKIEATSIHCRVASIFKRGKE